MSTLSASQQIEELEQKIQSLKQQALLELKEKLEEARRNVAELETKLAELTGKPAPAASSTAASASRRQRRPSISDEELKPQILKAMAEKGMRGLNAKEIAECVGQDPLRIRKFIANNPSVVKRQGAGPGTRFFLK